MITYNESAGIFQLDTKTTSYVIGNHCGHLLHLYWGAKVSAERLEDYILLDPRGFAARNAGLDNASTDVLRMEYPTYGSVDLRTPAFGCVFDDGSNVPQLRYASHKIANGKPALPGLPSVYAESGDSVQTLEIELADSFWDLHVFLTYAVFEDYDAITRSVRVENRGAKLRLTSVMSASVDMPEGGAYDFLHLTGAWARERHISRSSVFCGKQSVDSKRGASSHHHNPFAAFVSHDATEESGEAYALNLVYSGNFEAGVEMDSYDTARYYIGVNPFGFSWTLEKGESFQSPEAVLVYSGEGLGGMSRIFHRLYRERLCRGRYRDVERYVLINNWEATYFNFTEEKLLAIADKAKEIGLDLLVLDDGWFGKRNDDKRSLGDWYVNAEKLPEGLDGLAEKLKAKGLHFGLWFEPEMISPDSDLYRAHPDWALQIKGRESSLGRNQLVLDLSRGEICDYIIDRMTDILSSADIKYVKWDMNRSMSEVGSAALPPEKQGEVMHRYILGLYRILETVVARFPDVLFESCSGGGGRFDPGLLYYMPQAWCSDDTDAVERLYIQYGTSMCYPFSSMGAHVSVCPNHQVGRTLPFSMRGDVAMLGQFGYELDLSQLSDDDLETAKKQVEKYRRLGGLIHSGDCYRLKSPFRGDLAAFNFVSRDKRSVVLCQYVIKTHPSQRFTFLKMKGLLPDAVYTDTETGLTYTGSFLMNAGLPWKFRSDGESGVRLFQIL